MKLSKNLKALEVKSTPKQPRSSMQKAMQMLLIPQRPEHNMSSIGSLQLNIKNLIYSY